MIALAVVGLIFCYFVREGVNAAHSQAAYLKDEYLSYRTSARKNLFEHTLRWPRPFGDLHDQLSGNRAAKIFPTLMIVVWTLAVLVEFAFLVAVAAPILEVLNPAATPRTTATRVLSPTNEALSKTIIDAACARASQ